MAEGTEAPHTKLLVELAKAFSPEKVLTDPVDLYVYSFHGEFATRRRETPVAVLRRLSEGEERELEGLARASRFQVIRNNVSEEDAPRRVGTTTVILDSREPLTPSTLQERLTELEGTWAEGKLRLKGATSFADWFVSSLRMKDGYRIIARPGCDDGFCVVQPFLDGVETFSSKGRLLLTRGLLKGELEPTERLVEAVYTCTACGQCYDQLGSTGLEVNNAIVRGRHEIVKSGMGPRQYGLLTRNIREDGNPLGMPAEDRTLWHEELAEEFPFRGNEVLYWAGCSTSYRLPGIIEATTNVLQGAGLDFGLLGDKEGCCGLILYLLGLWDEARGNALETSTKLVELGTKRLVTSCAGCYYAFSKLFPEMLEVEMPCEVLHTSELIEKIMMEGRLSFKAFDSKVTYHDPCALGRHAGVYDPPRSLLKKLPELQFKEMPLTRSCARCCGGGGGLWSYNNSVSMNAALNRLLKDVVPLNVDILATACPTCQMNLKYTAARNSVSIKVFDFAEIAEAAAISDATS